MGLVQRCLSLLAAALLSPQPVCTAAQEIDSPVISDHAAVQQKAEQGVPLSGLAPNAPESYTVRRGDTLWRISGLFLKSQWRWPDLWRMNSQRIGNPRLIYPGQQLHLERADGRAWLRAATAEGEPDTVRVSPRTRIDMLGGGPLPTLEPQLIEPFLTESLIVGDNTFERAPRLVAVADENRVLAARGDRAYARGAAGAPLLMGPDLPGAFRVFRSASALKDPVTGNVLGYEGQYVGRAELVRGESEAQDDTAPEGNLAAAAGEQVFTPPANQKRHKLLPVPATINIIDSKQELRLGDRLLPEPPRDFRSYVPHAPGRPVDARVVKVHGNSVRYAGQNQIVIINKGRRDGIGNGHVLAVLTSGQQMIDKTDDARTRIKLPDERNGLAMVFRPFERVSYALVMEITSPVQVGDRLVNPK
ncbi:MAG: LysM peptidoglycan-binding domain-containing protein [Burkholderiaceae bacterium]|jgi:hypothetical protein|nr:LysM peptidoglycan-binding domain-containing protein [Burkholderiaceae bacterium]